jgi:hypothetical protein
MFRSKNILNATSNAFFIGMMIISLMALTGLIGCSDSGGDSRSEYHLTGYNGLPNTDSKAAWTASSNTGLKFYAQAPWFVNTTFQVYDADGFGVSDLLVEDFNVLEDSVQIDPIASELNLRKRMMLPSGYTYTLKTVLLLDNSPSTIADFKKILDAAQVVVDNMDEKMQQQIAIVAYDEAGDPVLIQDFTNNVNTLNEILGKSVSGYSTPGLGGLDAWLALFLGEEATIKPTYGTTNFYSAVKYALSLWEDNPSPENSELVQGFLVAVTDGNDTTGLLDVDEAISARGDKQVFTVSVGTNFSQAVSANMERLGNAAYYPVPNPGIEPDEKDGKKPEDENLCEWMLVIQNRMIAFADSFYWLQYKSEKTSVDTNKTHTVQVSVIDNGNREADAIIQGTFSSSDFITGAKDIYFDATAADPSGITEKIIMIERGQAAGSVKENVTAITYSRTGKNPSEFTWESADNDIIRVAPKSNDSATGVITVNKPGETLVTVKDTANNVSNTLIVKVVVREFSYEIIQHELESAPPWFVDATFQVRETNPIENQWNWVTDLKREELTVIENKGSANENLVDLEKSEINLRKRDRLPSYFSYALKTVILIDNSPSQDENTLDLIKEAAKSFVYRVYVNNPKDNTDKGPLLDATGGKQQEIAIRTFSEDGDTILVQDFTSDKAKLDAAIDSIPRGFGPINFYRGMMESLFSWDNDQSVRDGNNQFKQGVVLVLTDGWDSLIGFYDRDAVLGEIKDKQVICVGVADDLATEANIDDLKVFGNAGYYSVPNPGETIQQTLTADTGNPPQKTTETITVLQKTLRNIQHEILDYANSFYWLNYKSYIEPAGNCANTADLDVVINNNSNESNNDIAGEFETCEFFDGIDGMIYVNSTATNPWGEDGPIDLVFDSTRLFIDPTFDLDAVTYNPERGPFYTWKSSNNNIVNVLVDENSYAHSRATLSVPLSTHGGSVLISIEDIENVSTKSLQVNAIEIVFPMPIAYYPFNGNAIDETGHGYDGETFGATLTIDRFGRPDSAYLFDGNDYIALDAFYGDEDDEGLISKTLDEVTVFACFKTSSTKAWQDIVGFDHTSWWGILIDNGFVNFGSKRFGPSEYVRTTKKYNDGQWHCVCATLKANQDVSFYVDDIKVGESTFSNTNPISSDVRYGFIGVNAQAVSYNGPKSNTAPQTYVDGSIDDILIFDKVLTDTQIHNLFKYLK